LAQQVGEEGMIYIPDLLIGTYPTKPVKGEEKLHRVSPSRILKCPRNAFMEALGYREPIGPVSEQNMEFGTLRHSNLQKRLLQAGLLLNPDGTVATGDEYKEEVLTLDDPPLLGYMDGRMKADNEVGQAVLEIKTIGKKLNAILTPLNYHVDQSQLYMYITGLPEAYILYESKLEKSPDYPWKQFVVKYDEDRAEKLLRRGRTLYKYQQARRLPFPEPGCFCKNPACYDKGIQKKENLTGFMV
jgi:hypothetical protein